MSTMPMFYDAKIVMFVLALKIVLCQVFDLKIIINREKKLRPLIFVAV